MSEDQKNLFLAMGLSLLVIIGWQYFYATPKMEQQREQVQRAQQGSPDRKSTRLNSSHIPLSRMPSSA